MDGGIEVARAQAGLDLTVEHEVVEVIVTVDSAGPDQVEDDEMTDVEGILLLIPVVYCSNNVEFVDLPHLQPQDHEQSQEGRRNVPIPRTRSLVQDGRIVRTVLVVAY